MARIHCREQEVQVNLEGSSSKEEGLGYIMIKLKIESGMTSLSQKNVVKAQKQPSVSSFIMHNNKWVLKSLIMDIFHG